MSERDAERSVSQTVRAQLALRDMILSGRLRPGERISELQAVDITGVSRTPVRLALVRLEDEGLLQAIPSGGFMVKAFTERDILDSIELRGTLEGLAARFAAERGVSARSLEPLKECLARSRPTGAAGSDFGRSLFRLCDHERALSCHAQ